MVTFSVQQFANECYYEVLEAGPEQGNRRRCSPTVLLLDVSPVIALMPGYIATQDQSKNMEQQKYSGDRSNRTMNRAKNQASAKVDAYKVGNS